MAMALPAYHLRATPLPSGEGPLDLWIADGRITFHEVAGAAPLAADGGFVAPGLVDGHTHLYFANEPITHSRAHIDAQRRLLLSHGVLLARDMGAMSDEILGLPDDDGLPVVQAAGRCLLMEPRPPFVVTAPQRLAEQVTGQARSGAAWVKIFADWPGWPGGQEDPPFGDDPLTYSRQALGEAVQAAHAAGTRVATHAFGREGAEASIAAGVDSIEHGWGLDEALLAEMARRQIAWTPMLGIAGPMLRGAIKARNDVQGAWIRATLMRMLTLLPSARRMGVPLLAGSDWFPAVTVVDDVVELHRHGLSNTDALAAASSGARAFLGAPGLEEGAPADLVLFRGDPRGDLEVLRSPEVVMLRGRVVDRAGAGTAPRTTGARA